MSSPANAGGLCVRYPTLVCPSRTHPDPPTAGGSPAALFAYASAGAAGASIRLYAARPLLCGNEVTITYGDHSSGHFAQYYGFVPKTNPHDTFTVSLLQLLRASGVPPPKGGWGPDGWDAACELLERKFRLQTNGLQLRANAPDESLVLAVRAALAGEKGAAATLVRLEVLDAMDVDDDDDYNDPHAEGTYGMLEGELDDDARMVARIAQVIASACANFEDQWPTTLEEDELELSSLCARPTSMPRAWKVLVEVRASRKRLLRRLQKSMLQLAAHIVEDPRYAWARVTQLQQLPSAYPFLDSLPIRELEGWAGRTWNWDTSCFDGS